MKDRPFTVWVNSDCDSGNLSARLAHFRWLSLGTEGIYEEPGLNSMMRQTDKRAHQIAINNLPYMDGSHECIPLRRSGQQFFRRLSTDFHNSLWPRLSRLKLFCLSRFQRVPRRNSESFTCSSRATAASAGNFPKNGTNLVTLGIPRGPKAARPDQIILAGHARQNLIPADANGQNASGWLLTHQCGRPPQATRQRQATRRASNPGPTSKVNYSAPT